MFVIQTFEYSWLVFFFNFKYLLSTQNCLKMLVQNTIFERFGVIVTQVIRRFTFVDKSNNSFYCNNSMESSPSHITQRQRKQASASTCPLRIIAVCENFCRLHACENFARCQHTHRARILESFLSVPLGKDILQMVREGGVSMEALQKVIFLNDLLTNENLTGDILQLDTV